MYLMYVDESGDPGNNMAQSHHFCLSGLVVHESEWHSFIDVNKRFRRKLKDIYGLPVRAEMHAVKFIRHSQFGIAKHERLAILRNFLDELAKLNTISITNVVVEKAGKSAEFDIFGAAWRTLFQRFENTLAYGNFPGGYKRSFGSVYTDATNGESLVRLMRKMSVYNPVPNRWGGGYRDIPITKIVEDPSARDSQHSLPIQACDVVAYFLHQKLRPNSYVRKKRASAYFDRLEPVLNKYASNRDPWGMGVVRL
ncbi:DUF3800 domain-containing protein [Ruegeria arenilitoris]|uniref:DUF3800 domain-containing protein n=1 Tax=Ruegeria arenilitoris TaxID=1173585 RepID=UPI00147A75D6|nr:DUF3800 domain-containing protein [Ruegeria arenilitoris]